MPIEEEYAYEYMTSQFVSVILHSAVVFCYCLQSKQELLFEMCQTILTRSVPSFHTVLANGLDCTFLPLPFLLLIDAPQGTTFC